MNKTPIVNVVIAAIVKQLQSRTKRPVTLVTQPHNNCACTWQPPKYSITPSAK